MTKAVSIILALAIVGGGAAHAFPPEREAHRLAAGEMAVRSGTYEIGEDSYEADFAYLAVPQNYESPKRLIHLELIRIRSPHPSPAEPVFWLEGGPGVPNVAEPKELSIGPTVRFLLTMHDVVMVGYRGYDFLERDEVDFRRVTRALRARGAPFEESQLDSVDAALRETMAEIEARGIDPAGYTVLDVLEDLEAARRALGYGRINLAACSYGTRVAYLYGRVHPESLHRTVIMGANPPGGFVFEPEKIDAVIQRYGDLWKSDSDAVKRSPDIVATMDRVLDSLPRRWLGVRIDPDKVKGGTQALLFNQTYAATVFDAYVAAENGDYSGLAMMSIVYNFAFPGLYNFDAVVKAFSLDFDPNRDYLSLRETPYLLDSPIAVLQWTPAQRRAITIPLMDERYRRLEESKADALIINGTLDMSTPIENARMLHEAMPNSILVELENTGHCSDIQGLQPKAFERLVMNYLATGEADTSLYRPQSVGFLPQSTFQRQAKAIAWGAIGGGTLLLGGIVAAALLLAN